MTVHHRRLFKIGKASLLLFLTLSFGFTTRSEASTPRSFSDMEGHWALTIVQAAVAAGYVDGFDDGTFRPEARVSRAQFTAMVIKARRLPIAPMPSDDSWYEPYTQTAYDLQILHEDEFPQAGWNRSIRRHEMLRMTARAVLGEQAGATPEEWKRWAVQEGLLHGDARGELHLEAAASRAEAAAFLERVTQRYALQ